MPEYFDQDYLEKFLETVPENPQALVLSAYLEEKEKWEKKLSILRIYKDGVLQEIKKLEKIMLEKRDSLDTINVKISNESGLLVNIFRFFSIRTKAQKQFYKEITGTEKFVLESVRLNNEFENALNEYDKLLSNPPDTNQYELAMIGNTLFKPR